MKKLITILIILISSNAFAAKPTCHSEAGGYCQYTGKVDRIYVNTGIILMYFDTAMPIEDAEIASFTISQGIAGAISLTENPEFAKLFYSTALAAQASKRNVTVQMRGSLSGYLKIDRIWLTEE